MYRLVETPQSVYGIKSFLLTGYLRAVIQLLKEMRFYPPIGHLDGVGKTAT